MSANATIILTDLDGTLLRSDATLSAYTVQTVTAAIRRGIPVSYATARSYTSSTSVVSAIPWNAPIVLYNGALLFDPVRKQVLEGFWLEPALSNAIIETGKKRRLTPYLFALDETDTERVLHEPLVRRGEKQFYDSRPGDPRFREVAALACPDSFRTLGLTYIGLQEELEPLRRELEDTFGDRLHLHYTKDNYIENHYFLEASHPQANKREGAALWARYMNVDPAHITAFGDNLNDIGLFEAAGTRIAVANAQEKLKQMADRVVESNDEDGVARYIAAHMIGV
ncbi:HAD hydrolase family protein [Paenibacillus sp. MBLB4367]|uniref:HAD hydrolase family protein n=1 Tax=Paenibacillus sp. MBLB4367 TaxID=3384767 RepID=UPI00390826A6